MSIIRHDLDYGVFGASPRPFFARVRVVPTNFDYGCRPWVVAADVWNS